MPAESRGPWAWVLVLALLVIVPQELYGQLWLFETKAYDVLLPGAPYRYMGCFQQQVGNQPYAVVLSQTAGRSIPGFVESCCQLAYKEGYSFCAIQNGTVCWSSSSLALAAAVKYDAEQCTRGLPSLSGSVWPGGGAYTSSATVAASIYGVKPDHFWSPLPGSAVKLFDFNRTSKVASADECEWLCAKYAMCTGATYRGGSSPTCDLKVAQCTQASDTCVKDSSATQLELQGSRRAGTNIVGFDLAVVTASSAEACLTECSKRMSCRAAVFRSITQQCALKSVTCENEDVGAANTQNPTTVCVEDNFAEVLARKGQRGPGMELDYLCAGRVALPGTLLPDAEQFSYPMVVEVCAQLCMFNTKCRGFTFTMAGDGPNGTCRQYAGILRPDASITALQPASPPTSHACLKLTSHAGPSLIWLGRYRLAGSHYMWGGTTLAVSQESSGLGPSSCRLACQRWQPQSASSPSCGVAIYLYNHTCVLKGDIWAAGSEAGTGGDPSVEVFELLLDKAVNSTSSLVLNKFLVGPDLGAPVVQTYPPSQALWAFDYQTLLPIIARWNRSSMDTEGISIAFDYWDADPANAVSGGYTDLLVNLRQQLRLMASSPSPRLSFLGCGGGVAQGGASSIGWEAANSICAEYYRQIMGSLSIEYVYQKFDPSRNATLLVGSRALTWEAAGQACREAVPGGRLATFPSAEAWTFAKDNVVKQVSWYLLKSSLFTTSPVTTSFDFRGLWLGVQQPTSNTNTNTTISGSSSLAWVVPEGSGSPVMVSEVLRVADAPIAAGATPGPCGVMWVGNATLRYAVSGLPCNSSATRFSYICEAPGRMGPDHAALQAAWLAAAPKPPPPSPPPSPSPSLSLPLSPLPPPPMPSSPRPLLDTPASSEGAGMNVGVIAGPVAAGAVLVAVAVVLLFWYRTKRSDGSGSGDDSSLAIKSDDVAGAAWGGKAGGPLDPSSLGRGSPPDAAASVGPTSLKDGGAIVVGPMHMHMQMVGRNLYATSTSTPSHVSSTPSHVSSLPSSHDHLGRVLPPAPLPPDMGLAQQTGAMWAPGAPRGPANSSVVPSIPLPAYPGAPHPLMEEVKLDVPVDLDLDVDVQVLPNSLIGRGSFGKVHVGRYRSELVAVKTVYPWVMTDADGFHQLHALRREMIILSKLQHPNIVKLYGGCLKPPKVFLVEELMDTSLEKLLYSRRAGLSMLLPNSRAPDPSSGGAAAPRPTLPSTNNTATPSVSGTMAGSGQLAIAGGGSQPGEALSPSAQPSSGILQRAGTPLSPTTSDGPTSTAAAGPGTSQRLQPRTSQPEIIPEGDPAGRAGPGPGVQWRSGDLTSGAGTNSANGSLPPRPSAPSAASSMRQCVVAPELLPFIKATGVGHLPNLNGDPCQPATPGQPPAYILDVHQILSIGLDIAQGLVYMHPLVVHRDLKPGNVLLSREGHAKLGDFGLARSKTQTYLSKQRSNVGTVAYMAPECFTANIAGVSYKIDIYSFGVIMNEMLTGIQPWKGLDKPTIIYKVGVEGVRPPLADPERCPVSLARLINLCWATEPDARPDADTVVAMLRAIQEELGSRADSSSMGMGFASGGITSSVLSSGALQQQWSIPPAAAPAPPVLHLPPIGTLRPASGPPSGQVLPPLPSVEEDPVQEEVQGQAGRGEMGGRLGGSGVLTPGGPSPQAILEGSQEGVCSSGRPSACHAIGTTGSCGRDSGAAPAASGVRDLA